jgi:exosortase/archaeosortase family protein
MYEGDRLIRPNIRDAILEVSLVVGVTVLFLLPSWWELIAVLASLVLAQGGVPNLFASSAQPVIYVRLNDGQVIGFSILLECAGFITVAIYGIISALTMGLMRVRLAYKMQWLVAGMAIGTAWNVTRLVIVIAVAYFFGVDAFGLVHFVLAPFVDFLWIVVVWTLGMSYLEPFHRGATG